MPWTPSSGPSRHTKKANTGKKKRQWAHVANSMMKRGYREKRSIMAANSVVGKGRKKKRGQKRR